MEPLPSKTVQDLDPLSVKRFWEEGSCGEVYAKGSTLAERLHAHSQTRYQLEPYILEFGRFADAKGKDVLEIGVGMGDDHEKWAEARPRRLIGIDLTQRAVSFTAQRQLESFLCVTNAEALPFSNSSFDIVYSWGVLHHTPNTEAAIAEVLRILRRGGVARIMIYHRWSVTVAMLWIVYGSWRFWPIDKTVGNFLESPGTRVFSRQQASKLFANFQKVSIYTELGVGDLLIGAAGQRHEGKMLRIARSVWPRRIIKRWCRSFGLGLLIEAQK